jgi:hypothetical protein
MGEHAFDRIGWAQLILARASPSAGVAKLVYAPDSKSGEPLLAPAFPLLSTRQGFSSDLLIFIGFLNEFHQTR